MRLLTYLVGCSVDGFTAGPDGQCDPFGFDGDLKAAVLAEYPETVPDHARRPLGVVSTANRLFDTVVMGRGVYESARGPITGPKKVAAKYVRRTTVGTRGGSAK